MRVSEVLVMLDLLNIFDNITLVLWGVKAFGAVIWLQTCRSPGAGGTGTIICGTLEGRG
jgi:hypothetical protein